MKLNRLLFALLAFLFATQAFAIQPGEMLADPKLEMRARSIDQGLRCLVCQNENIDDSNADLAHDLRVLVRQRILAGDSDAQVKQYIVARYGDYVLLKPPFKAETYLLWFAPALLLVAAGATAWVFARRQAKQSPPVLSPEDEARIAVLLQDDAEKGA